MTSHRVGLVALCFLLGVALAACGGGNPAAPTSAEGVTLVGTVVGGVASSSAQASSGGASASALTLTVFVQENPAITATVAADGSFTLRGLPPSDFTLVFQDGGVTIGSLAFRQVNANQQITITVMISGGTVVLLEQRRNGIGHGDLEIEGLVEQVLVADPAGESRFMIDGHLVVARPGQTAIREGNRSRSVSDVTVGRRVHVKAVWLPAEGSVQPALANEIKLQGASTAGPGPDDPMNGSYCPDAGRKAEVEGRITAKGASDITVFQTGKGDFLAVVDAGTRIRHGNTSYTFEQLAVGNRVHVKGQSTGFAGTSCGVDASEIKLQN
jgi:Domain of unknown function (DUF5666)